MFALCQKFCKHIYIIRDHSSCYTHSDQYMYMSQHIALSTTHHDQFCRIDLSDPFAHRRKSPHFCSMRQRTYPHRLASISIVFYNYDSFLDEKLI